MSISPLCWKNTFWPHFGRHLGFAPSWISWSNQVRRKWIAWPRNPRKWHIASRVRPIFKHMSSKFNFLPHFSRHFGIPPYWIFWHNSFCHIWIPWPRKPRKGHITSHVPLRTSTLKLKNPLCRPSWKMAYYRKTKKIAKFWTMDPKSRHSKVHPRLLGFSVHPLKLEKSWFEIWQKTLFFTYVTANSASYC